MDLDMYLYVFELMQEMHPDSMMCVHSTKVIGNQIHALVYIKYTENRVIRRSMELSTSDPTLLDVCPTPRSDTPALESYLATKTEEERFALSALVCSTDEIMVYGTGNMILTFEDFTKKITRFEASCEYTSFSAVL